MSHDRSLPNIPADPAARAILLLRLATGTIWAANLWFVVNPANHFFDGFGATALGLAGSSVVGPGLADFAAQNALVFAILLAAATAYLCVAFLLGLTTRAACVVGGVLSGVILLSQWNATFAFPGGTDVGPHPVYIAIYVALVLGRADRYLALDAWLRSTPDRWWSVARRPAPG